MTTVVRSRASRSSALRTGVLAHRVEVRRRLVENQDRRVLEQGAGDRHALALAARELRAALADDRVEPSGSDATNSPSAARSTARGQRRVVASGPRQPDVARGACR